MTFPRFLSHARPHLRSYSSSMQTSAHAQWYAHTAPAMIPIFLLGSAIYLGLQLTQLKLSHEKYMEEAAAHVKLLEAEVDALQHKRSLESIPAESQNKPARWW